MSSESNGRRPDSQEPGPSSGTGTRSSARAPSAWGATRDALAAVHNLEALLRSSNVLYRTIRDLLPELRSSAGVLRETFGRGSATTDALGEASSYGLGRVEELDRLLEATALADEERDDLADRSRTLADELEASADLLALLDRASEPAPTEVRVELVVRGTTRPSTGARGRELALRVDAPSPDCTVDADPYVLGSVLSLLIARVHATGAPCVVVRASCDPALATFQVRAAGPDDAALPESQARVLPAIPPAEAVIRRVAQDIGASIDLGERDGKLALPRHVG
jgi:hypothetical protein